MDDFVKVPAPETIEDLKKVPIVYKTPDKKEINYPVLSACRRRNPGYVCLNSDYFSTDNNKIVAYRPSEICDYDNYKYYLDSDSLKGDFKEARLKPLYFSVIFGLILTFILMLVFYKLFTMIYEVALLSFLISLIIGIIIYYIYSKIEFKNIIKSVKQKTYSKNNCYTQIYEYGTVLAIKKEGHENHKINPETLIVEKYVPPNDVDVGVMLYYDKWNFDVKNQESIRLFKKMYEVDKYKFMTY